MSLAILAIIQHNSPLAPPKHFFSTFFLRSLGFDMKRICKKFAYAFIANTLQWANNACFIREWLQWRPGASESPLSDSRPLNQAACGHGTGRAPLSAPNCCSHRQNPQKLQDLYTYAHLLGSRALLRVSIPCPFHRGSTDKLSLYFAVDHPRLLNIYYHTTSSQWVIKSPLYLGLGVVTD